MSALASLKSSAPKMVDLPRYLRYAKIFILGAHHLGSPASSSACWYCLSRLVERAYPENGGLDVVILFLSRHRSKRTEILTHPVWLLPSLNCDFWGSRAHVGVDSLEINESLVW